MNPVRKKRLYIVLAILCGVSIAVALALTALQENINLFYTRARSPMARRRSIPAFVLAAW